MSPPDRYRPLERFAGLAERYAVYRPTYPAAALDWVEAHTGPAAAAYRAALVKFSREPEIAARREADTGRALLASPRFESAAEQEFPHGQELTEEGLLGRAATASYAPRDPAAAAELAQELR